MHCDARTDVHINKHDCTSDTEVRHSDCDVIAPVTLRSVTRTVTYCTSDTEVRHSDCDVIAPVTLRSVTRTVTLLHL